MPRVGFTMKLFEGMEEEYRIRHNAIWPELVDLLKNSGIKNYSIFLDNTTNILFGVLEMDDPQILDKLPSEPVMQKWWSYMKDIMESNPDNSPVSIPLKEVFFMP
ncbi:MAG TPA: L-rhamnose mutarotase [Chitinophagaceae bacterium]